MEDTKKYDDEGYVVLRQFFTFSEVMVLEEKVDRIYKKWIIDNEADYIEHKLVNMHSLTSPKYFENMPHERIAFFESIAQKKLTDVVKNLFGEGINFHNTQLFFNPYKNGRLPYWHRDMQYSPIDDDILQHEQANMLSLHVRIPLIKETGVELVPGTHKRWDTELENNVRMELNEHKNNEQLPGTLLIRLDPGDILIFNAQMIHRGNYELNETRKALDLCVGKPHHFASKFIDEGVLPSEKELIAICNNKWFKLAREQVDNKGEHSDAKLATL